MKRTFNFTGRKRIVEQDARIKLVPLGNGLSRFDAEIRLDSYGLPPLARVFVEAFDRTHYKRLPYGIVGAVQPPPENERILTEFRGCELIRFRVKVVATQERAGTLLGEADGITPRLPGETDQADRLSLLHVRPSDIGDLVWKLNYPDGPNGSIVLLINESIPDYSLFVRSPHFSGLAFPQLLREVLMTILVRDPSYITSTTGDGGDSDDWGTKWITFARALVPEEAPPMEDADKEEYLEWIDRVVCAFAKSRKSSSGLIEASGGFH